VAFPVYVVFCHHRTTTPKWNSKFVRSRGVTIRLDTRIVKAGEGWVELSDGTQLQTKTLI